MGAFSHLTRRKFIKSAAAGAGAMAASQYVPDELMADTHKKILPPDGRFKNIELTYFQDNNWHTMYDGVFRDFHSSGGLFVSQGIDISHFSDNISKTFFIA